MFVFFNMFTNDLAGIYNPIEIADKLDFLILFNDINKEWECRINHIVNMFNFIKLYFLNVIK